MPIQHINSILLRRTFLYFPLRRSHVFKISGNFSVGLILPPRVARRRRKITFLRILAPGPPKSLPPEALLLTTVDLVLVWLLAYCTGSKLGWALSHSHVWVFPYFLVFQIVFYESQCQCMLYDGRINHTNDTNGAFVAKGQICYCRFLLLSNSRTWADPLSKNVWELKSQRWSYVQHEESLETLKRRAQRVAFACMTSTLGSSVVRFSMCLLIKLHNNASFYTWLLIIHYACNTFLHNSLYWTYN